MTTKQKIIIGATLSVAIVCGVGVYVLQQVFTRQIATFIPQIVTRQTASSPQVGELVIAGEGNAVTRCIDFDSGKLFDVFFGPEDEPSPEQAQQWWKQHGIDAMGDTRPYVAGLVGFDLVAVPVPSSEWDTTPARFDSYLSTAKPGTPVTMSAKGDLPATFMIQTREGSRGLLQILGLTEDKRGVRIRYKLMPETKVKSTNPSSASPANTVPAPVRRPASTRFLARLSLAARLRSS